MAQDPRQMPKDRVGKLFPVLFYDPEPGLYLLEDQSIGFAFLCEPLSFADPAQADRLSVLLNMEWPRDTLMQLMLWASPDVERQLAAMQGLRVQQTNELLRQTTEARAAFLRRAAAGSFGGAQEMRLRDLQVLITLKIPVRTNPPKGEEIQAALELRASAERVLRTAGLQPRAFDDTEYVRMMSTMLNWETQATWRTYTDTEVEPDQPLRDQLMDWDHALEVDAKGLTIGEQRIQTFSIKRYPDRMFFGLAARFLVDISTGGRGVPENLLVCMNLHFPDAERSLIKLSAARYWANHQASGPIAGYLPKLRARKRDFDTLFERLEAGDRPVRAYLGLVLFAPKAQAVSAASNLRTYWRELGFQILPDKYAVVPMFINNMPFGGDLKGIEDLRRYRTRATGHLLPALPVFGDWKGTRRAVVSLVGRTGQLMGVNLFDSPSNYNAVIAAPPGMGKSFLANEIVANTLAVGGRCWVIDVGRSYEKSCEALGGQFIAYTRNNPPSASPFAKIQDWEEEADIIAGLVGAMVAPTEALGDFRYAALKQVLHKVWDEKGQAMEVDDVAHEMLAETDQRVRDLGRQLSPFTSQGEYGRYFRGQESVTFDKNFVVLELEELKGRRHLQLVVLLQLIYQIQQAMYFGDRNQPKVVLIDEGWDLLMEGDVSHFIEHGYRRFRKYQGSAITILHSLNDLYERTVGRAIADTSAHTFMLAQPSQSVDQLLAAKRLPMNEGGAQLLKSVHTMPGEYSEIMLLTDAGAGIGRLIVDPFTRLLYSTNPVEVAQIQRLRERGMSYAQAIRALLGVHANAA